eukprot:2986753-Pyramimonas_sp.AAC.1
MESCVVISRFKVQILPAKRNSPSSLQHLVTRERFAPVDGAAVDQRGEHAQALAEAVAHRGHADHHVQVLPALAHKVPEEVRDGPIHVHLLRLVAHVLAHLAPPHQHHVSATHARCGPMAKIVFWPSTPGLDLWQTMVYNGKQWYTTLRYAPA